MEPEVMDGGSIVVRGSELAYLLLPGLDSSQNHLEARNLADGPRWKILPGEGGVIFGFAMDPSGSHLAYLEVDSRPSGALVPWRGGARVLAGGARPAGPAG